MSDTKSVSSTSSSVLSLNHPLALRKAELRASYETKAVLFDALNKEMKEMQIAIANIDQQIASPTFGNVDIARSCVFVGPKKTGKFRQLHINEDDQRYYLTDAMRKTKIEEEREIFVNSAVRAPGK